MKKILLSLVAIFAVSGCAYDYYNGEVRYIQDGTDCIYHSNEHGDDFNAGKRIVYSDTICAHLYKKDVSKYDVMPKRKAIVNTEKDSDCESKEIVVEKRIKPARKVISKYYVVY